MRMSTKDETKYMPMRCASHSTTLLFDTMLDQARKILTTVSKNPRVCVNTRMPTKPSDATSEMNRMFIYKVASEFRAARRQCKVEMVTYPQRDGRPNVHDLLDGVRDGVLVAAAAEEHVYGAHDHLVDAEGRQHVAEKVEHAAAQRARALGALLRVAQVVDLEKELAAEALEGLYLGLQTLEIRCCSMHSVQAKVSEWL